MKPIAADVGLAIARAAREYDARARRATWERRWQELTGRPWGWKPPLMPRLTVSLGSSPVGMDTEVWLEDLPLHRLVSGLTIEKSVPRHGDIGTLTITIPIALVSVVSLPPEPGVARLDPGEATLPVTPGPTPLFRVRQVLQDAGLARFVAHAGGDFELWIHGVPHDLRNRALWVIPAQEGFVVSSTRTGLYVVRDAPEDGT